MPAAAQVACSTKSRWSARKTTVALCVVSIATARGDDPELRAGNRGERRGERHALRQSISSGEAPTLIGLIRTLGW